MLIDVRPLYLKESNPNIVEKNKRKYNKKININ